MALKKFKPDTPSKRGLILVDRSSLWKGKPEKTLTKGISSPAGRNNHGRITCRHKGGGHKRRYRLIDFRRNKHSMKATIISIEYDPNRTAFIALIEYEDKTLSYILAPQKLSVGDKIISGNNVDIKIGNALSLKSIPVGTIIHNVEMKPLKGGQLARSAGSYVQLVGKDSGYALLKLRSGEVRSVRIECWATIGAVSNPDQQNIKIGKAGRNRWLGVRPTVRGVAMNPIDHPHGGGEGKTSGGRHPVSPWGQSTKGKKTRSRKKSNKFIVKNRHSNKGNK